MEVFNEITKTLTFENKPSIGMEEILKKNNFRESDFNIIGKLNNIPQEKKFHPEGNVWNHTKMVIDLADKIKNFSNNEKVFMWAALLHDIGKITTTKFIKGRYRSYNHDTEGAKIVFELIKNYEEDSFAKEVSEIVRFHMHHIYILKNLPFSNIKALMESKNFDDIILLFICDKLGRGNQGFNENKKSLNEVCIILDMLEEESGKEYRYLRNKAEEIERLLLDKYLN